MRLTLAFVLLGAAGILMYAGFTDPPGGIGGVIGKTFGQKPKAAAVPTATPSAGQIAEAIYSGGNIPAAPAPAAPATPAAPPSRTAPAGGYTV